MNGLLDNENIYYYIFAVSLSLIPALFFYKNHIYNESINRVLNNNQQLFEYGEVFLIDFFSLTNSSQLINNFLNNKHLYNFFKNLVKLYPSYEFLIIDFTFDEKKEIISFLETVKLNSFEVFAKHNISKRTFFNLLYIINKKIFCLDI